MYKDNHMNISADRKCLVPAAYTCLRAMMLIVVLVMFTGCDSGSGSGPEGRSTVQGYVTSFSVNGVSYIPQGRSGGVLMAIVDFLVPPAQAAVGGVGVHMAGTDFSTTTGENGFFIMSGVPAGNYQMQFLYQGQMSTVDIEVPNDGVVTMNEIQCNGRQNATVGHMNVQMNNQMQSNNMPGSENVMHGNNRGNGK